MDRAAIHDPYTAAGVDTAAGDRAVELMKASVAATQGSQVLGGIGGFAGLWDASALKAYRRPVLASSTDGVGTKVAIAQAIDKHDTIGHDLVGMVVDDIVVVGATPLFLTDYIACGSVVPERIAEIVAGIADGCRRTGTALIGGETAEHPDLLAPDEYDLAGAAVGAVEADALLGAARVRDGDAVLAIASSGLHANGFSLVRRIVRDAGLRYTDRIDEFAAPLGEVLLEPTRLYTAPLLRLLASPSGPDVHALSHVTGGGIAANLARVLPAGSWVEVERGSWTPPDVFAVLADRGGLTLTDVEGAWNLGVGMLAVLDPAAIAPTQALLQEAGMDSWVVGQVSTGQRPVAAFEQHAKGAAGGAVRLTGTWGDPHR
ncbi:phosphoribosylformylglycinamidine cyclo-ligase [uncultured Amnibacterium sp.]|uniref:phosphoribosylformylglycinamidine cyclo-ligase n=1 Tax=uncultured Amnibacterium sp. TaxID=1631851 RepID=UPI0035C994D3